MITNETIIKAANNAKVLADLKPVASSWQKHGEQINTFPYPPPSEEDWAQNVLIDIDIPRHHSTSRKIFKSADNKKGQAV